MGYISLFLFAVLASGAVAGPVDFRGGPCARHCAESSKFKYEPGTTYVYDYEADTTTTLQGTTKDESRLHLKTRVEVDVISKCDFVMRLSNIDLTRSEPNNPRTRSRAAGLEELQRSLERHPLRFSFQDGIVESVCPNKNEEAPVMNIKRGILSTLQTSMSDLEGTEDVVENDVAGKCTTKYQSLGKGWNSVNIRKAKNFATCTDRHNANTAMQADLHSGLGTSTTPLVMGSQECEQSFSNGILQKVVCTEQHMLRPFSKQTNGAVTKVSQTLTYKTYQPTKATGFDYASTRQELLFDHKHESFEDGRKEREAEMAFMDLCTTAKDEIKASVPGKFTRVVYAFRSLDYRTMSAIFRRINSICPNENKAKKFFLDALPMIGNSGSVRMMKEMIENDDVKKGDAETWFTSMAFLSKPTKEMIKDLTPILDGRYEQALLGVSAMINTFCKNNQRCGDVAEVQQAIEKIATILGNNCNGDKKKVLLALKAIGNIGVPRGVEDVLGRCINKDTEIRMAAMDAYRRFPCDTSRDNLLRIFTNSQENVEVRIKSYLAVMKCPTSVLLETIEKTLREEKINQVGSFVWSHLNNMAKREGPLTREIHRITSDIYLMNKFVVDIRKYSRNMDTGIFFKGIDTGFDMGSNLIFTPESYIPRSAMVNLTVDIFGQKVNLFEVEGRAEGFEHLVDSMFGPDGYLHHKTLDRMLRKRNVVDPRVEEMDKTFKAKELYYQEPSASLDMKIFGNTLWHKKLNGGSVSQDQWSLMDILVELAKDQDIEISKSIMFLDTTYTIPTGCGLPLHVAINGTATVDMKVRGKFDVRSLDSMDIRGQIQPSGAVEISTMMTVDAIIAKSGVKVVATLHSSNIMDGVFEIRKGSLVRAQLNMPRDQMEVINVQSKILLMNGDKEHEQMGATDRRTRVVKCSGGYTDRILGVELCGEMSLPSAQRNDVASYPFSGPATLHVYLRKTDPTLTGYSFEIKWTPETKHFNVIFNTPESRVDREVSLEFKVNDEDRAVFMKLRTPFKRMGFSGKYQNDESEKKLDMSVNVDDVEKFAIQAAMSRDETEHGIRYMPTLKIQGPVRRHLNLRGVATIRYGQKWSGELAIDDLTEKPITLRGDISTGEKGRYEGQLSVNSQALDASIQGYAQLRNAISSKLTIEYRILDGRQEKLDLNAKFRDMSASSLLKYTGSGSLQSTSMPEYSTALWWETQIASGHIENTMEASIGDGRVRRVQKITFQEILRYSGDLSNNEVDATLKLTYPENNLDWFFNMAHKNTPDSLNNKMTLRYKPSRQLTSLVNLKYAVDPLLNVNGDVQVTYPGREVRLSANVNEAKPREYEASMTAAIQRGKQVKVTGAFRNKSARRQLHLEGNLEVLLPSRRPMSVSGSVKQIQAQSMITGKADFGRGSYSFRGEHTSPSPMNHRLAMAVNVPEKTYTGEASLMNNKEKLSAKIDLNLPAQRRITGSLEATEGLKKTNLDLMWDADRDQSRRVTINTEYELQGKRFSGSAIVKCPGRLVRTAINTDFTGAMSNGRMNAHAEVEWQRGKMISMDASGTTNLPNLVEGNLKIRTPFNGLRNLDLKLKHEGKMPEWNSLLSAQWQNNQKFTVATNGKFVSNRYSRYIESRIDVVTPFRNLESFSFEHVCDTATDSYSTNNEVIWNKETKIGFGFYGSVSRNIRAGMNFTSPFETLRQLSASMTHEYSRQNIKSHAEALWNNRNQLLFDLDGRSLQTGNKRTCNIDAKINTPFRGYEKLYSQISYNNDGVEVTGDAEVTVNMKKYTAGFTSNNRNTRYGTNVEGKLYYTTPIVNYESAEIRFIHVRDTQKLASSIDAKLPYNQLASLKIQGEYPSEGDMKASSSMTLPGWQQFSSDMTYKTEGPRVLLNGQITYGRKQIKLDASGQFRRNARSWNLDGNLLVNTPFRGYEDTRIGVKHSWQDKRMNTQVELTGNRQTFTAIHSLQFENFYNFKNSIKVTGPYSYVFVINHSGDAKQFRHESELEWARNKKATATLEIGNESNRNKRSLKAKLDLKTPFYNFDSLNADASFESTYDTLKPRVNLQWNGYHQVNLEGEFRNQRYTKMDAKMALSSTFRNFESMTLDGKLDLSKKQKTLVIELQKQEVLKVLVDTTTQDGIVELSVLSPLEGYQNLNFKGTYGLTENQYTGSIVLGCDDDKVIVLNAQVTKNSNGNGLSIKLKTPIRNFENVGVTGRYAKTPNEFSCLLNLLWAKNKQMDFKIEQRLTRNTFSLKSMAETPFHGFESMFLELTGELQEPRLSISSTFGYAPDKKIECNLVYSTNFQNYANFDIVFRSPFRKFEELSLNGKVEVDSESFKTEGNVQWHPQKRIGATLTVKSNPMEAVLTLDSPFDSLKTMKIVGMVENRVNHYLVDAQCEWNGQNKIEFSGFFRNTISGLFEGKVMLKTPFRSMRRMSLDSSLKSDANQLDGKIAMVTPFASMPKLEANGQYRKGSEDHSVTLNLATPNSNYVLSGNIRAYIISKMEGSLNVETPIPGFETLSVVGNFNSDASGSLQGDATVSGKSFFHKIAVNFRNVDGIVEGEAKCESSYLNNKPAGITFKANTKDLQNMEGNIELEANNRKHSLFVTLKSNRRGMEWELKVKSPLLPRNDLTIKVAYSNRRSNYQGSAMAEINSQKHSIEFVYDLVDKQVTGKLKIQCPLLPMKNLNLEGKLAMPSDNSFEGMLQAITPRDSHSLTCILKFEPRNFESQITISSPLIPSNTATAIGKLQVDPRSMEGFMTFNTPRSETRLAANTRTGPNGFDGTLTLNTPFEPLKMMRVDAKFNNNRNQLDGSLELQSSMENLRKVSVGGKLNYADNAIDTSVNLRLPVREYSNINFLGTVHKNRDWSSVSPRLTLSVGSDKYAMYGRYENNANEFAAALGYEKDMTKKGEVSLNLKNGGSQKTMQVSVATPFRGYENYEISSEYGLENNRHKILITFKDAKNRNFNLRGSGVFHSWSNFNVDASASTPFIDFQEVSVRAQQTFRRGQLSSAMELSKNNKEKLSFNLKHSSDRAASGFVSLDTPYESLPSTKVMYSFRPGRNSDDKVEVEYAGKKVILLHETKGQEDNQNVRNIRLEVIPIPVKIHWNSKALPLGTEVLVKTTFGDRNMAFNTLYQASPAHFSHSSKLTLDEKSGQSISYEIRKTESSRKATELYGRLDLPVRSFEVRGQDAETSNGRMVSADLYWDAVRDVGKHMSVSGEIRDLGNRGMNGHKLQLTLSHPKLTKDIVARSEYTVSATEVMGKMELEYSKQQQNNLFVEARVQNLARSRRDMHYTASVLARHQATNTDVQLSGEVLNNGQESVAEVKVNYMDSRRRQRVHELKTKIMKLKKEIEILSKNNDNTLSLMGRMFNRDGELTLALEEQVNRQTPSHSHFRYSKIHKNMDVNITTSDGDTFHVRASMPKNTLHFVVSHTNQLKKENDILLDFGLKENNLLFAKLNWRPEMMLEAKNAISEKYAELSYGLERSMSDAYDGLSNEVNARSTLVKRTLDQELNGFYNDMEKELYSLKRDYQTAKYSLKRMYMKNEFYVRDVAEALDAAGNFVVRALTSVTNIPLRMFHSAEGMMYASWETVSSAAASAKNYVDGVKNMFQNKLDDISDAVSDISDRILMYAFHKMEVAVMYIAEKVGETVEYALEKLDLALDRYAPSIKRSYNNIVEKYGATMEWLNEMKNMVDMPNIATLYTNIAEFIPHAGERMTEMYNTILSHPHVTYARDSLNSAYEQSKFVVGNFGLDDMASNFMREAVGRGQEMAWGSIKKVVDQVTDVRSGVAYEYQPHKGVLNMEMRLPESYDSPSEILDVEKYTEMLTQLKNKYLVGNDFCIWDVYYKYKNYLSPSYWIPPFTAQAMLAGSQHYWTFDQFHFDFAGECSYLLARDFINGTFTVTVNYIRDGQQAIKKSLNIFTEGVKLEIGSDFKVTVDDTKVELPQVFGRTVVTREDGLIHVVEDGHYHIKCNLVHDFCTMTMSGFYFGKTGGMFGIYDYEPALDMTTPENKLAASVEDYADTWKVGSGRCQKHNMAQRQTNDHEANRMCKELFDNNDSIFRACFKQVKPNSYLHMCTNDVGAVRGKLRNEKLCTSAAAYVSQCKFVGVQMQMPKHCVLCEKHDGSMMEGGDIVKITPSEAVESADIVFVVEEKRCNRDVARIMNKLAQGIEGNLKNKGYRSVRFAVVGFGGIYPEPHVVTADSNIFGTVRSVDSALSSINFGNGPADIFVALRYAASLPFRMGATKSIVLAKCSSCQVETMKADYSEMLRTMLDGDITLHLLMEHEFVTKFASKVSKAKRVLGLDRKYAYTIKDMKDSELSGDSDLLAQLRIPKDLCVPLALEVGGSFFGSQRLLDGKRGPNKKAVEVLAKRVAKTAEPSECQVCECIATEEGIGKSFCQRCVSPVVASMLSGEMSPMMYSDEDSDSYREEENYALQPAKPTVKRLRKKPKN